MGQVHTPIAVAGYTGPPAVTGISTTYSSQVMNTPFKQRHGIIRGLKVLGIASIAAGATTLTIKMTSDALGNLPILAEVTTDAIIVGETLGTTGVAFATGLNVPFDLANGADLPTLWIKTDLGTLILTSVLYQFEAA